ncbi:AP2-like ethylene-responsive transcription factor AIL5 [Primulina huaijiensis]|uniref:AP2-like ethylene-responsive transcription factor AIL5 n=1 Tax=Primulina huaijiensis TaxID=1492673 RepID=UPI003CC76C7E
MDMDSNSDDHQNWLAFSLSNNSLFQPLLISSSAGVVVSSDQENGSCGATSDNQLSVLGGGGPKLEDFLGGSSGGATSAGADVPQFGDGAQEIDQMYDDLEFKNIAASFLRGFSDEERSADTHKPWPMVVAPPPEPPMKKAVDTFSQRTSIYRGVTRHRWTGRYEAHLWDNSCRRQGQSRKGRQVYLGGYDKEEKAARAYDLAAIKYWGPTTTTNFPVLDYEKEIDEMKSMTRQEFVASLRRRSSGFSRGASMYRGVTRHHQHGRWQARIGRVAGNKDLYLGTFSTQEEAAEAYDIAAIKFRGLNAVTNFDMSRYDVQSIASCNLPVGGVANKSRSSSDSLSDPKIIDGVLQSDQDTNNRDFTSFSNSHNSAPNINFALPMKQDQPSSLWAALGYQNPSKNPNPAALCQDLNPGGLVSINDEGFFDVSGVNYYHGGNGATDDPVSVSDPTRIAVNGNNGTTETTSVYENGTGSWINNQSLHLLQQAKPNISAFQTPIFGLE